MKPLDYYDRGLMPIPLIGKRPVVKWKDYQHERPTRSAVARLFKRDHDGIAILTGPVTVVDFDEIEPAREFFKKYPELCKTLVRTRRGIHVYFNGSTSRSYKIAAGDVKGHGGYVVAPDSPNRSYIEGYELTDDLPDFPAELFPRLAATPVSSGITDARAYISRIFAVAGEGGHNATFRAACRLLDAGLSEAEALAAMIEWNESNADPPWSLAELTHKVKTAAQRK